MAAHQPEEPRPAEEAACYEKALRLLANRSHFIRQLEDKLAKRGFAAATVERVLDRLRGEKLLDDERVAEEFVRQRLRRGPVGRRRMWQELRRRGAEEGEAEAALEAAYAEIDPLEATRRAAALWCRRGRRDAAALARHLDRKGFPGGAILQVVGEMEAEWEADRA